VEGTKEVGEKLGLPFLDVLSSEPAANRPFAPAALPEELDLPTDRAAKFDVSKLLGALSGLPSGMTREQYGAIIAGIDSANKQRAGLPLSTHHPSHTAHTHTLHTMPHTQTPYFSVDWWTSSACNRLVVVHRCNRLRAGKSATTR
jgi:hypothetical protein